MWQILKGKLELKHITTCSEYKIVLPTNGLYHIDQQYLTGGFYLQKQGSFESQNFSCYANYNTLIPTFLKNALGTSESLLSQNTGFLYTSFYTLGSFHSNIDSDKSIKAVEMSCLAVFGCLWLACYSALSKWWPYCCRLSITHQFRLCEAVSNN